MSEVAIKSVSTESFIYLIYGQIFVIKTTVECVHNQLLTSVCVQNFGTAVTEKVWWDLWCEGFSGALYMCVCLAELIFIENVIQYVTMFGKSCADSDPAPLTRTAHAGLDSIRAWFATSHMPLLYLSFSLPIPPPFFSPALFLPQHSSCSAQNLLLANLASLFKIYFIYR